MILLIDLGNSRLKWGCWPATGVFEIMSLAYGEWLGAGDFTAVFKGVSAPEGVWVASVLDPASNDRLRVWVERQWGVECKFAMARVQQCGVINGYSEPERLGIDRWLAMVAGRALVSGVFCVVDCGTAVTIDLVDREGRHLGGLIAPGVGMMADALGRGTRGVAVDDGRVEKLGRNSCDGVASGIALSIVSLVERVVSESESELESPVTCLLTGGDADYLRPHFAIPVRIEEGLVLQGLAMVSTEK